MARNRVRIGPLMVDSVSFDEALARITELVGQGAGGSVFTPNVDHVVKAETNAAFRAAYERADLCLADGMWLVWASRLLGSPLPEKVSGSDLLVPLLQLAARRKWRVYVIGGGSDVAVDAAELMSREHGVHVVGSDAPTVDSAGNPDRPETTLERLTASRPDVILVAFGAPKQELWIDRFGERFAPAVAIGVGGSLDFLVGRTRRAPAWMSRVGLEWAFRLGQEPRRMWRRYLVEDPRFAMIVARGWREARRRRLR